MDSNDDFELLLGDDEWDRQHHEFHECFRRLEAIERQLVHGGGPSRETLLPIVRDLLGATLAQLLRHIQWEERLMAQLPSDEQTDRLCAAHRQDHYRTARKLSIIIGELEATGLRATVANFGAVLLDWLIGHVDRYDTPLRDSLSAHGRRTGVGQPESPN